MPYLLTQALCFVQKKPASEEFKALQKKIDGEIVPIVQKVPLLKNYIKTAFSLSNGQLPHLMKF